MSNEGGVNSRDFWEKYFAGEWSEWDGPGQSQHFMLQLLAHLPSPELEWLTRSPRSILDWGCATGEGTEILADLLPGAEVTGLDFAQSAIDVAVAREGRARYLWHPEGEIDVDYDVIVTSNCLEHFDHPESIAQAHAARCRSLYLVLVPFEEHPLHEQHFAQFRLGSLPERLGHLSRLDQVPFDMGNCYWPGRQLLVTYASEPYLSERPWQLDSGLDAAYLLIKSFATRSCLVTAELGEERANRRAVERLTADLERQLGEVGAENSSLRTEHEEVIRLLNHQSGELAQLAQASVERDRLEQELDAVQNNLTTLNERLLNALDEGASSQRTLTNRVLDLVEREERSRQEQAMREQNLRDQLEDALAQAGARSNEVVSLAQRLSQSTHLLQREERTVLRPVARRLWGVARPLGRHLPIRTQDRIRATLAPVVRHLAPHSAQATYYELAQQRLRRAPMVVSPAARAAQGLSISVREAATLPLADTTTDCSALADPGNSLTFVIFSVIAWDFRFQRPQQVARALGKLGHTVLYIEPDFLASSASDYAVSASGEDNVFLCRLSCPTPQPRIYETLPNSAQQEHLAESLLRLIVDRGNGGVIRVVQHPFWAALMRGLDLGFLVYDLMDDHSGFLGNGAWLASEEARLVADADLVTVSAERLLERVPRDKAILMKNAADLAHFSVQMVRSQRSGPTRIGYYGAIAHWFDSALIEYCARSRPDWEFELIGSTFQADLGGLENLQNVTLLGEKPYEEIPRYLANWDVATIPFQLIPLTMATNPVKAYEYLAAGKPVVATPLPELERPPLKDWVRCAASKEDFLRALDAAVAEAADQALVEQRRRAVLQHSWASRADDFVVALRARQPRVSIVVVCYGRLELTQHCVRSLFRNTQYPDWEVVLVDNASPDGTGDWLSDMDARCERVHAVLNTTNRGFAGGVNDGVASASGDVLVVMNNDVRVTPGWLGKLVRHLKADERCGLVGPVTNAIGNEAAVNLSYANEEEMVRAAVKYTADHFRECVKMERVAFFAVGMLRGTWESVGPMDEAFGLGYFEDDDYCKRVTHEGFRVVLAEDVFVHHELSASFDSLGAEAKRRQFEASRRVFEAKWGTWEPHQYRPAAQR